MMNRANEIMLYFFLEDALKFSKDAIGCAKFSKMPFTDAFKITKFHA